MRVTFFHTDTQFVLSVFIKNLSSLLIISWPPFVKIFSRLSFVPLIYIYPFTSIPLCWPATMEILKCFFLLYFINMVLYIDLNLNVKPTFHSWDKLPFSSVQFSRSVVSESLWPNGPQHTRSPCPSPAPRVYSNSCPLSWWCHPTISSSVVPFSARHQSFPASGYFSMSQFFASGGQSIGASASTSVLPMKIQGWFPLVLTCCVSLQCMGLSKVFSNTTVKRIHSSAVSFLYSPTLTSIHDYWKNQSLD